MIAAHGGTITAEARADGTGALIRIVLPVSGESIGPAP
jgi:hypothetical protein